MDSCGFVEVDAEREESRSCAKMVIITSLCSKLAGFAALSAFWIAKSSSNLFDDALIGSEFVVIVDWGGTSCKRALVAIRKWASVGGLKEESRI